MRRRKASGENRDSGAEGDGECSEYAALVGVELGLDDGSSHLACTSSSHVATLGVQDGRLHGSALNYTRQ